MPSFLIFSISSNLSLFLIIHSSGLFHHCSLFKKAISSISNLYRINFDGTPTFIEKGSISFVTTVFAPIIAPSPIFTPPKIVTFSPIQTSLPIITEIFCSLSIYFISSYF